MTMAKPISPPASTTTTTTSTTGDKPRRARVALACRRCKTRKQKCDGLRPSCSNCTSFDAECKYIKPARMSRTDPYLKATEERVAELESILEKEGIVTEGNERWRQMNEQALSEESENGEGRRPAKRARSGESVSSPGTEGGWPARSVDVHARVANPLEGILRDLSLEASGGFIGASSSISMSRMVSSLLKDQEAFGRGLRPEEHLTPKSLSDADEDVYVDTASIPQDVADTLLRSYLKHISTRWPIIHSAYLRSLHARRSSLSDSYEKGVLHHVYSCGGRFLETTGETGLFYSEQHHLAGMQYLDSILACNDVRSVQVLILLAIYSLRSPKGPGAYTYIGLSMRLCIDLGMHRAAPKKYSLLESEMRKRIFWTCYCLDRQVSIVLGRPFAVSDRDIDAELPLDVDESTQDALVLEAAATAAATSSTNGPSATSTSLSCFIHICRLRRIESAIQQSIYRVDRPPLGSNVEAEVEPFLRQLEEWKERIPSDARQHSADKPSATTDTRVIDGYGYYMVYYYKCLRFLLHPVLSAPTAHHRLIKKCAEACGGVCQTYKKLHQSISVGFSLMALHSVFLAGLTLVYCTWSAPQEVFSITTSNDMNACSIVLYIITERWPGAKRYRDMYEAIKQSVFESIETHAYEPRRAIRSMDTALIGSLDQSEEGGKEVSRMVADMAGEPIVLDEDDGDVLVPTMAASLMAATMPRGVRDGLTGMEEAEFGVQTYDEGMPFGSADGMQDFDLWNVPMIA
ncbi:hypothetical protein EJ06DRAFT_581691 [Trichodelitschia bisporula]|uniref:Zn(2)-C6 fungal-type domain-containing protein n=1 Tax=Trichodelitschia bisporula TaxID=703511 RepID=A0A6G1HXE5_9PEZI|nr:hypothetical protein EJ06DRAFT_581691 [Trichodelitschia bisporula]